MRTLLGQIQAGWKTRIGTPLAQRAEWFRPSEPVEFYQRGVVTPAPGPSPPIIDPRLYDQSQIDPQYPVFGNPQTATVRANFAHAKDEIEELLRRVTELEGFTLDVIDGGEF